MQKSFHRPGRATKRRIAPEAERIAAEANWALAARIVRNELTKELALEILKGEHSATGTPDSAASVAPLAEILESDAQAIDLMSRLLDHAGEKIEIMNKDIDDTRGRISGSF